MPTFFTLLLIHLLATAVMTGLIWFVQLVHYPLMADVGQAQWVAYERKHQRQTTWIVAPAMLVELASAVALLALLPDDAAHQFVVICWINLSLLIATWLSTALWQMPLHRQLNEGFDRNRIAALVNSNWLRTTAWTVRCLLLFWLVLHLPLTAA